ncbi:hypothetical protein BKA65DRAFT_489285 [Rhexocercosporidium sp. MPI-PUGE-AT-0058]|nr:hypothetical protein BKA65DRAFT_489285 [Rhexocercosporidium sp. MPI-PUGE-AT-0058]
MQGQMAIAMGTPNTPQQRAVEQDEITIQNPRSNLPQAIFIPFEGFPPVPLSSAVPLSLGEKLQKTIENVENQQALVKSNIMYLAGQRAGEMIEKAERELLDVGEGYGTGDEAPEITEFRRERRRQVDAMMQFMRTPAKKDAKVKDFIRKAGAYEPSCHGSLDNGTASRKRHANGDIKLGSTHFDHTARSTYTIRKEVSSGLQSIVMDGTTQLEAYDKLSSTTLDYYKQAFTRRASISDPTTPSHIKVRSGNRNTTLKRASTIPGRLLKENLIGPPGYTGRRKTSTGMPMVGSAGFKTIRNMEESIRRDSK